MGVLSGYSTIPLRLPGQLDETMAGVWAFGLLHLANHMAGIKSNTQLEFVLRVCTF